MRVIEDLLSDEEVAQVSEVLLRAPWADGGITAGTQSASVKRNRQLPEDCAQAKAAQRMVLAALGRSATFIGAALPKRIYPPLFNRYAGKENAFGDHVDNAVRTHASTRQNVRTDIAATLFLSEPLAYDGGELCIQHALGHERVKLAAGSMLLYPAGTVHRVDPVTRGARVACFFWIESMVRNTEQRELLADMDASISALRSQHGETAEAVSLVGSYHNLLRMWADVA
jgi:PKHD-type hydroxylase